MKSIFNNIIYRSVFIFLTINIIMTILIIYSYTFVLGWLVGSYSSIMGFSLSYLITSLFSKKITTRKKGFWFGLSRTITTIVFHGLVAFAVISINTHVSNKRMFWSGVKAVINPINFFTYLGGISLVPLATFSLLIRKKN